MDYGKETVRVGLSPHALGVFALRSFRRGERIGPVEGEVIEDPLYESDYCMELGNDLALEPDPPFRHLNHSCRPNCALVELQALRDDGSGPQPELWLEVEIEIEPGDQLTIDYAWPVHAAIPCGCGCPECRGWIVAAEQLDRVTKAESQGAAEMEVT